MASAASTGRKSSFSIGSSWRVANSVGLVSADGKIYSWTSIGQMIMARLPRSLKKRLELAGVPTPLEQAAVPKEWLVPEDIALRRDRLCWRSSKPWPEFPGFKYAYAKRTPGPGLLEQFVALSDASDEDILRYARHWGVLVICHHGLPASHSEECKPMTLSGRGRYVFWEPVEN